MLKAMKDFKPNITVILGDFADMYTVSSHSKDPRRAFKLRKELAAVKRELRKILKLSSTERIFVAGNHEDRLQRYMQDKAPEIAHLISIPKVLGLGKNWKYIPYRSDHKIGKLYVTHDIGSAGRNSIFKCLDSYQHSNVTGHCLPYTYKVMTPTGPVALKDISVGDKVLAYENGRVVISTATEKVRYAYTGDLAAFNNNTISMQMTSKHHLYTNTNEYISLMTALETKTKADLVTRALPLDAPEFDNVSDDLLRLIVAYCADGSVHFETNGGTPQIRFHLSKQRKIDRLSQLIESNGSTIEWTKSDVDTFKSKNISAVLREQLVELAPNKQLPVWFLKLSARQRQVVVDELVLWDGSVIVSNGTDYGSRQFCSYKLAEIELVQTLLTQQGIRTKQVSNGTVLTFNIKEQKRDNVRKLKSYVSWTKVENLEVGCITTKQQNFFVMTDKGNIELSGNTHRMAYVVEGNAAGEQKIAVQFGWLGDTEGADYMHRMKARKDWALGFGVGYLDTDTGTVYLIPVPIVNYSLCLNGKVYR